MAVTFKCYEIQRIHIDGKPRWFLDAVYQSPLGGTFNKNITNGTEDHCLTERNKRILAGTLGIEGWILGNNPESGDPSG